jgi:hypothetical protein
LISQANASNELATDIPTGRPDKRNAIQHQGETQKPDYAKRIGLSWTAREGSTH